MYYGVLKDPFLLLPVKMTHRFELNCSCVKLCESWQRLTVMIVEWLMLPDVWIKWKTTGMSQVACQFRVWAGHCPSHTSIYAWHVLSMHYFTLVDISPFSTWYSVLLVMSVGSGPPQEALRAFQGALRNSLILLAFNSSEILMIQKKEWLKYALISPLWIYLSKYLFIFGS